jgi:hypothetical protein
MDPMWRVCGMRSKYIANGAQALAMEMHDAIVANGFSSRLTILQQRTSLPAVQRD